MQLIKPRWNDIKRTISLLLLVGAVAAVGCTKADINYGSQFAGNTYTNLVMVDSLTIETSTVLVDSFVTSGSGAAVLGSYKDAKFGQINAESYFQLQEPSFTDKYVSYDSLELVLKPNSTWYGDTTQPLQLSAYRLDANILNGTNTNFYNNEQIAHEATALGSKSFIYYPHNTDTIAIRLDDNLGRELFNKLLNNDANVATTDAFLDYFKGICIAAKQTNAFVFGCKDSIEMRLHYTETSSAVPQSKIALFSLYNNAKQFNHISIDRSGTALEGLDSKTKYLSSTATGNQAFMQYITGTMVKIRIPYIRSLLQLPDFVKITKASLFVKPVVGTYEGYYSLPDSLQLSETDKNNQLSYTDLTYSGGSTQYGEFNRDYLYEENTGYTYDLSTYLTQQLAITENNENGLLIVPPAGVLNTTFSRAIFGNQGYTSGGIKMQLYYLSVQ
jgi:hypothetical protein